MSNLEFMGIPVRVCPLVPPDQAYLVSHHNNPEYFVVHEDDDVERLIRALEYWYKEKEKRGE